MAEQSGERRVTAEVGEMLISLMVPHLDPELFQLMLSRAARSAAAGRDGHQGHRGEGKLAELLALIRDADIDRTQLQAILGLNPEDLSVGDDNPHSPMQ